MAKRLTDAAVKAAKADGSARREIPDAGAPGLYLVVQPSGARSWAIRYRAGGRPRKMTLGRYPATSLAEAREAARTALAAVDRGDDPAAARKAERAAGKAEPDRDLVRTVAEEFLRRHASQNRTAAETARIFRREVLPRWGERKIHDIARRDVIEMLDAIADRGAPVMANRTLAAVRKLFAWAVSRDVIAASPAAGVKPPAAETRRDRTLTDDEIRAFWRATAEIGPPFGPLCRLLLVTGQRLGEVSGMTEAEIDNPDAPTLWTIPAARAKNARAHAVPLSDLARAALAEAPRIAGPAGFVFTTTGARPVSGFARAKARLDAAMAKRLDSDLAPWRLHDLRRTAASGMARAGARIEVVERVLNHASGSFAGVAGVYQRHEYRDEMRAALDAWAALLDRIVAGVDADVIALSEARR